MNNTIKNLQRAIFLAIPLTMGTCAHADVQVSITSLTPAEGKVFQTDENHDPVAVDTASVSTVTTDYAAYYVTATTSLVSFLSACQLLS